MSWLASFFDSADPRIDTPAILLTIGFLSLIALAVHGQVVQGHAVDPLSFGSGIGAIVAAFVGAGAFKAKRSQPDRPQGGPNAGNSQ
jgi:predicted nicotinamide N-methyase